MLDIHDLLKPRRRPTFWTDFRGNTWRVSTTKQRLNFKYPAHAALRVHVHHRDDYRCVRCGVTAIKVPANYDGRDALATTVQRNGWPVLLVLDHIIPRAANGGHGHKNLQTLCEVCNGKKVAEDISAIAKYRRTHGVRP